MTRKQDDDSWAEGSAESGEKPDRPSSLRRFRKRSDSLWNLYKSVLLIWVYILALNGIYGFYSHFTEDTSPLTELIVVVIELVIIALFLWNDRITLAPIFKRTGFSKDTWWWPFAALGAVWIFMTLYFTCVEYIGFETISYLDDYVEHGWPLWSAFIMVSLVPGVLEELMFRGFIMSRFLSIMKPVDAIILQGAMFSVLHLLPMVFISHFVMGATIGFVRWKTKSIYPCILLHMAWNAYILTCEILEKGG